MFSSQRLPFRRKIEAIAVMAILVMLGLAIKPSTRTKADSLDTPPNQEKKQQATSTARVLQRQKQERQVRPENYDLAQFPVNASNEDHWRHLLWTTAVVEPREAFVAEALNQILMLAVRSGLSNHQVRTIDQAMKVSTQLYLSDPNFYGSLGQRFVETIEQSPDPEWVAVALSALVKGKLSTTELTRLSSLVQSRFPGWSTNVYLQTTLQEIADAANAQALPPLKDLLEWEIAPRQLHLYVLCRSDRRVLCRTVLKDRNGQFVRQQGELWSVPLLLESIHELGWNFTRGQTPQGIFRIEGIVPQPDDEYFRAYGQFSLINLYVPFEAGAKQFHPKRAGAFSGSLADYQALLPSSWQNYRPLQQSFWAGKAGRGLFRIHGSGESVDFFRGKDRAVPESYNWNPTIGCLSARELYNEKGQLIHADMPKILGALRTVGGNSFSGYLIVADIPATDAEPVSLKQIEAALRPSGRVSRRGKSLRRPKPSKVQRVSSARSHSLLQKSVASSRQIQQQVTKLSAHLDQLGQMSAPAKPQEKPAKTSSADLKPLPIAY
ncbi:MAG: hypothetical protein NW224_15990 [Leptolyngbyaceae cyanobacterium bins.302]|nr:hypothetical protein [Leptolyngbyaceae cyanobacterium bins.302]